MAKGNVPNTSKRELPNVAAKDSGNRKLSAAIANKTNGFPTNLYTYNPEPKK